MTSLNPIECQLNLRNIVRRNIANLQEDVVIFRFDGVFFPVAAPGRTNSDLDLGCSCNQFIELGLQGIFDRIILSHGDISLKRIQPRKYYELRQGDCQRYRNKRTVSGQ